MSISRKRFFSAEMLGVYVAGIAVVLSQLPPVYELFARPVPEVSTGQFIVIDHQLGRPAVLVSARIQNSGSAPLLVDSIRCRLEHVETGEVHKLSAEVYIDTSVVNPAFPGQFLEKEIGSLSLSPQIQAWNEQIRCIEVPSTDQVEEYLQLASAMRAYVEKEVRANPSLREKVVVPSVLSNKAREIFFENFKLSPGLHVFSLQLVSNGVVVAEYETHSFEISSEHIVNLMDHLEEYRFGGGIAWPTNNIVPVQISIK